MMPGDHHLCQSAPTQGAAPAIPKITVHRFPPGRMRLSAGAGLEVILSGIRMPRMNSITERWIQTCRRELLDRTLIWDQRHLLHALREFESFYNGHRPHRALGQAAPLRPLPTPTAEPGQIKHLEIGRRD
ncbi:integrase core domain-containing protein [Streptomyces sp. NPDC057543]|uniref:integrase core domain-containing protein n=1 Tax=Streptomyces sp. NPDC057543 TaxID=3346163 RepID=UPI003693FC0F